MSCGLVRLICEEPLDPPPGQEGSTVFVDVHPSMVPQTIERLRADGWNLISEWTL